MSLVFTWWLYFCSPESHPGYYIKYSGHVSLGFSLLWQFLRPYLFFMTLTVLKNTCQVFCRMFLHWSFLFFLIRLFCFMFCFFFFFMIRQGLWVWGKKTIEVSAAFITSHQRYIIWIWFTTADVDLDHPAEMVFIRFIHCKNYSPTLSTLYSLEENHHVPPTLKQKSYAPSPWA